MKSTKKAFIGAVLALVICFTMLVGSTLAWFTDSASVGIQTITTGTLNLTVEDGLADDANTWEGQMLTWQKQNAAPGDPVWWEPGATYQTEEFYIKNEGNLNLKFKIALDEFTGDVDLVNVLTFDIIADASQIKFNTGAVSVGTSGEFDLLEGYTVDTIFYGEQTFNEYVLEPNTYVGPLRVVAHMAESAGNEYMNKALTGIGFTILATQATGDHDSYNGTYDEGIDLNADGNVFVEDAIATYAYTPDGDVYLYQVKEDYAESTFNVPENVTNLATGAFNNNANIKEVILSSTVTDLGRGFDSNTTIERVVLNEGLTEISSRAFKATTALEEVVIPSTVTTIADNAFQKTALKEIVIPATVETIGETAFGASLIEKVTFEGNTSIQGYAFRGCTNLRTVIMKGDNNEFIASTLNNRNSIWFCNGESNNPNTSNITFHVTNETMARRVITAMTFEVGNTPIYIGDVNAAVEDKVQYFMVDKDNHAFQTVLDKVSQDSLIELKEDFTGNVELKQKANADVVINGNEKIFTGVFTVFGDARQTEAETLTIKNFNFVAVAGKDSCILSPDRASRNPARFSYSHNVTIEGCSFTDPDGVVDCAAIRHGDGGDSNWKVIDCTVDNTMHSLLQVNNVELDGLLVQGCTIKSKNGINLNQCTKVQIIDCDFNNIGYNVRYGVNNAAKEPTGYQKTFLIKDSTLISANDDGDANIIFRHSALNATLTIENTTVTANGVGGAKVYYEQGLISAPTIDGLN